MASVSFTDCFVSLGGTDMSAYVKSVTLNYAAEMLDDTAMGDTTRVNLGGLKNWSVEVEFNQDFTDNELDEDLFALVGASTAVVIRPVKSTVVGTGNPNYTGTGVMESYTPISGSVGDLLPASCVIQSAGTLTRATA